MAENIDHKTLGISRLAAQYRESTKLIAYLKTLLIESDTLEEIFQGLLSERWLDTAVGINLDILGSIVGQPRVLVDALLVNYFGFDPAAAAKSFGDLDDASVGGRFKAIAEPTTGNRVLTDDEYRLFIRARIMKNSTSATIQDVIDLTSFIFEAEQVILLDAVTSFTLQIGKVLDANDISFLLNTDLIPKPAGVFIKYQTYPASASFGFAPVPDSAGFGTIFDSNIGGEFARLIN